MSQMNKNSYKEWFDKSIQEGYIHCCTESDIELDPLHIGHGSYGVVYKATINEESHFGNIAKTILGKKQNISGITVAVKTLFPNRNSNCEEDWHRHFVKEVAINSSRYVVLHLWYVWTNLMQTLYVS